ncbi:hypothetical protein, partial [Trabulsiella odontotermitis]|uniref:hypothetical protein n=1 Tax=Trabulsiella odontotermitis TaxID=379893 RepID=UPI001EE0094D
AVMGDSGKSRHYCQSPADTGNALHSDLTKPQGISPWDPRDRYRNIKNARRHGQRKTLKQ